MKAFVLAAGLGTRLLPLTKTTPKPLVPVQGVPLVYYTLATLKHFGITDVVLNLHHLGEKIFQTLGDGHALGMNIEYSWEESLLGTGGGVARVLPKLSSDFLVINADVIVDFNLNDFYAVHKSVSGLATLMLRPQRPEYNFGTVTCQGQSVTSILEPKGFESHNQTHFTGVHIVSQEQLQNFFKNRSLPQSFCIVQNVYKPCLKENFASLGAYIHTGLWEDCGTFEALQKIEDEILNLSYVEEFRDMVKYYNHSQGKVVL